MTPKKLTRSVNGEARRRYHELNEITGTSSSATKYLPRLALRAWSEYPYNFTEDDEFYGKTAKSFGRVIFANRDEGLKAIHSEIQNQSKEHSWLYVPGENIWLDVATKSHNTSVETDRDLEVYLSHLFPEIQPLHTHPDKVMHGISQEHFSDSVTEENYLIAAAVPSSNDLIGALQMTCRSALETVITNGVVGHYGFTTYTRLPPMKLAGEFRMNADRRVVDDVRDPLLAVYSSLKLWEATSVVDRHDGTLPMPAFDFRFQPLGEYAITK